MFRTRIKVRVPDQGAWRCTTLPAGSPQHFLRGPPGVHRRRRNGSATLGAVSGAARNECGLHCRRSRRRRAAAAAEMGSLAGSEQRAELDFPGPSTRTETRDESLDGLPRQSETEIARARLDGPTTQNYICFSQTLMPTANSSWAVQRLQLHHKGPDSQCCRARASNCRLEMPTLGCGFRPAQVGVLILT